MTEEQHRIGQDYCYRAVAAIYDPKKFEEIMAEFEAWKQKEGIRP